MPGGLPLRGSECYFLMRLRLAWADFAQDDIKTDLSLSFLTSHAEIGKKVFFLSSKRRLP